MLSIRRGIHVLSTPAAFLFAFALCPAQTRTKILFDISSVKPAQGQSSAGYIKRLDVGVVSVSSMTVDEMIELFYHVRPYQISGGPNWVTLRRFDVTGKDSSLSASTQKELKAQHWSEALDAEDIQMQKILTDRFDLRMHHETKLLPTFALLADMKKGWPALPCSTDYRLEHGVVKGAIRMASLAALLKAEFGMPVHDETGLKECYYIDTRWSMDPDDGSVPYITTALGQLGLHLKKTTGDVNILVIDHAALPLPD